MKKTRSFLLTVAATLAAAVLPAGFRAYAETELRSVSSWAEVEAAYGDSSVAGVKLSVTVEQPADGSALSVSRTFSIDLNGNSLVVNRRLASVENGGVLKLTDSFVGSYGELCCGKDSSVRPEGDGGLVSVSQGGSLEGLSLTVAHASTVGSGRGGAFALGSGSSCSFEECRFSDCSADGGGAVLMAADGAKVKFISCQFTGNSCVAESGLSGVVSCSTDVQLTVVGCAFCGNDVRSGVISLSQSKSLVLSDCAITNNTAAAAVMLGLSTAGLGIVSDCVIAGNAPSQSESSHSIVKYLMARASVSGGFLDVIPEGISSWTQSGFTAYSVSGGWLVAVDDTLTLNQQGQVQGGVFAFDPSSPKYAGYFSLAPGAQAVRTETSPVRYKVVSVTRVGDFELGYEVVNGVAMVASVTRVEASPDGGPCVVSLPAEIDGFPVGFCANAFTDLEKSELYLNFLGLPPSVVETGAFPANAQASYPSAHAGAWKAAGVAHEGETPSVEWQGLVLTESRFVGSWAELAAMANDADVAGVALACRVRQPDGASALSVERAFAIDLNGHDLVASNRLAVVRNGGVLKLTDRRPENGAAIRGGCTTGQGGLVNVEEGGRVVGRNLTFADAFIGGPGYEYNSSNGGAVAIVGAANGDGIGSGGAFGSFENCRFVNCHAQRDAGALLLRNGRAELRNCAFLGNDAGWGGAVNTGNSHSHLSVEKCVFAGNRSKGVGGVIYAGDNGSLSLTDCVITNNTTIDSEAPAVYLRWDNSCFVTNTLIADNRTATGVLSSVCVHPERSYVSFSGGVMDAQPVLEGGGVATWAAEGFTAFSLGNSWSVALADTLKTNELLQIEGGVFGFDPSAARYADYLTVSPKKQVARLATDPVTYEVVALSVRVDDFVLEYEVADGVAMVVNVRCANDAAEEGGNVVISIPGTIADLPVGLAANAFDNLAAKSFCLNFLGAPPTLVEPGAVPADAYVCYPKRLSDDWKTAGTEKTTNGWNYIEWQGLIAVESPYVRSWDDLAAAVGDPDVEDVELLCPVVQPSDGEALSISRYVAIGLNGHDLIASNRLADVRSEGYLELYDDLPERGGAVRGGCRTGSGGLVYAGEGGRVAGWDVTFADAFVGEDGGFSDQVDHSGGAVALWSAEGYFENCRFVNCRARRDGGAVFHRFSQVTFCDCQFVGNAAGWGGAINVGGSNSVVALEGCELVANRSQGQGGGIYVAEDAVLTLNDSVVSNNTMVASRSPAVYLAAGSSCFVTNSLIVGNWVADEAPLGIGTCDGDSATVSFSGGATDAKPVRADGSDFAWAAEGLTAFERGGFWSVAVSGTLSTNTLGWIRRGVFLFDPTGLRYASYLTPDPSAEVTMLGNEPPQYEVRVVNGGPYATVIDGVTVTYRIVNGNLYIGDGEHAAVDATLSAVVIPETVDGSAVYGISANAFSSLPASTVFFFQAAPPADVATGAFPDGAGMHYTVTHEDEWRGVVADGRWAGMNVGEPVCDSWKAVCQALAAGKDVKLDRDLTATDEGVTLAKSAGQPTLDFAGHTVTVSPSLGRVLRVGGEALLTLADSVGGGGFSGNGEVRTSGEPAFEVMEWAGLRHKGGKIRDFRETCPLIHVASNGVYQLDGGEIVQCCASSAGTANTSGFLASVESGLFEIVRGGITGCTSTGSGVPLVSLSGTGWLALRGGWLLSCSVAQDARLFSLKDDTANLAFYGTVVADNVRGGTPVAVDADRSAGVSVFGGAFDVRPASVARGFEALEVPSPAGQGNVFLVARTDSVALAKGVLTAGEFSFDPTDKDSYGLYLPLPDPRAINLTHTSGDPELWRFAVNYQVKCDTLRDLRANLLVGNDAVMSEGFVPQPSGNMPSGFVYRAAVVDDDDKFPTEPVEVALRLYATATGGTPLWSGTTNVTPRSEGVFQIWVDDGMRDGGSGALADAFTSGEGVYLGVSFAKGAECTPRRNLVSAPLVSRAACAAGLDAEATAAYLYAPTGTVTCADLNLGDGGLCNTLEIAATNAAYNVSEMDVGGFTLYRHADNRILSSKDGEWIDISVKPGDVLVPYAVTSGLLTIKSDDGDTVPLLTVPVPAGGSFTWQSTAFTGKCRWTYIGENN